jgi:hypothetical protein|tara:strand:- start:857 stop:1003 length:147 start_codon:yes stop_codon:yes gene_type:complete
MTTILAFALGVGVSVGLLAFVFLVAVRAIDEDERDESDGWYQDAERHR